MSERPKKPQKSNPHELTVKQHIFPRASLQRFVADGGIDVRDFKRQITRRARSSDDLFCANRAWGHGPESGWMKATEDAFQALVAKALDERPESFDAQQSEVISEFYALWQARGEHRNLPMQTIPACPQVIGMSREYTADELEFLEKNGIGAFLADGSIQMRHIMGPKIRLAMDDIRKAIADRRWSLVEAKEGEFCVPDVPAHGIIPLNPSIVLHSTRATAASLYDVAETNAAMARHAREYIFARSLANCPGITY